MGAKETLAALDGQTTCLEAALDGQTCIMLGEQTGTVLGGRTHCLGTLTFSELIASLWENATAC